VKTDRVLIVGGGIDGAGLLRELALNGVDALLVDKSDYAAGATSASSRMIHGGLRYLENGEFRLVRESLLERNRLLRNAPHAVQPLPTTIPVFSRWSGFANATAKFLRRSTRPARRGAALIKVGLSLYDVLTARDRVLPTHRFTGRAAALRLRPQLQPDIVCTATSVQTHELATSLGLRVVTPDEIGGLDIAIDGADEVDPRFNLTKGGGAAHTREKIVAAMTDRFVVVVDESKLVPALGPFGTPLEVLDFAPGLVAAAVERLGSGPVTTRDRRSDNGNLVMDAHFPAITDPQAMSAALASIPGIVEHGIFPAAMVERVIVAGVDGVRELVNDRR